MQEEVEGHSFYNCFPRTVNANIQEDPKRSPILRLNTKAFRTLLVWYKLMFSLASLLFSV